MNTIAQLMPSHPLRCKRFRKASRGDVVTSAKTSLKIHCNMRPFVNEMPFTRTQEGHSLNAGGKSTDSKYMS